MSEIELTPEQKKRAAILSWKILEEKYWYYEKGENRIDDWGYDKMEKEYKALGGSPCVGFPNTNPFLPSFSYAAYMVKCKMEGVPFEQAFAPNPELRPKKTRKKKNVE